MSPNMSAVQHRVDLVGIERHFLFRLSLWSDGKASVDCAGCGAEIVGPVPEGEARRRLSTAICGWGAPVPGDAHRCGSRTP